MTTQRRVYRPDDPIKPTDFWAKEAARRHDEYTRRGQCPHGRPSWVIVAYSGPWGVTLLCEDPEATS